MSVVVRKFDVVIFGATGYTGQYAIEELATLTKNKATDIKWAVAGRDVQKVKQSLQHVQQYLPDINILQIPIIKADINDKASILDMCKTTKLVMNCVGPYKFYGETVVSACIEAGTHHVDISGEFSYLEETQAKYFSAAREKGVYVVQACGFDSIPPDYGISLMKKKFPGDLNSVEYYVQINQGPSGRTTNIGTFLSALYSVTDFLKIPRYDRMLKKNVFTRELVQNKYPLSWRLPPLFYSDVVNGWCIWFLGADERIIKRSQMFRHNFLNERPVECHTYMKMSIFTAFLLMIYGLIFVCLSVIPYGSYLLSNYPSLLSNGWFSKDGPTRKQVEEGSIHLTLIGEGWKDKLLKPTDQHTSKPDTKLKLTITGPEPAYVFTSMCLVSAGLVILQESDKLPLKGGVLTPGIAFENTSLSKRLEERGVTFTFGSV